METEVITIQADRTMRAAGTSLYEHDVGSVIVRSPDSVPMGIITPRDVLEAIATREKPLAEIVVTEFMSRPLVTIKSDKSVRTAVRQMNEEGIEQLVILDGYDVTGVIAQTDVIDAYESLIKSAFQAASPPKDSG